MTNELFDLKEYAILVTEIAKARKNTLGDKFNEVDFFCGAMVAYEHLGRLGEAPANWIFAPMLGKDILAD
jgi:hypothetical protein